MIGTKSANRSEYIYTSDPALDKDSPQFSIEDYWRTWDRKYLPLREGCEPTVFELAKLTRKQFLRVAAADKAEQNTEALAYSLKAVRNFMVDGKPLELRFKRSDLGDRVETDCLDRMFAVELFGELGLRIISLSTLDPTLGQG